MNKRNNRKGRSSRITIDLSMVVVLVIILGAIFAAFLFFTSRDNQYTESDEVVANLALDCESGKWVEFPIDKVQKNKFSGEASFKGVIIDAGMGDDEMTDRSKDTIFTTHPEYSLIFYNAREVEIEGKYLRSSGKKQVYVYKIRCIGEETKEEVKADRQRIMQFIAQNKQHVFKLSGKDAQVEIEDISFVDSDVAYIYFSEDEQEGLEVLLLMQFEKNGDGYKTNKLALYELVDNKFTLTDGIDDHVDSKRTTYEYDDELDRWVLVW